MHQNTLPIETESTRLERDGDEDEGQPFQRPSFDVSRQASIDNTKSAICCLPDLIDFNALSNPNHLFSLQEERSDGKHAGFTSITFRDLQRATIACATSLQKILFQNQEHVSSRAYLDTSTTRPLALVLESDVTLFVYISALLYINVPVLLLSIRLSPMAMAHLLKVTSAQAVVTSGRTRQAVTQALEQIPDQGAKIFQIPAIPYKDLITLAAVIPSTTIRVPANSPDAEMLILHSSGTTGLPKPIKLSHRYPLGYAACHCLQPEECANRLNVSTLPMYHGFGLLAPCLSLSTGKSCCFQSATIIPSAMSVTELLENSGARSLMTVPTILDEMATYGLCIDTLATLDFVAVGGGAIQHKVGQLLATNGVKLLNHYGATEIGAFAPIFIPTDDYDWRYLRLRTDMDLEVKDIGKDGENGPLCQLVGFPFGWQKPFVVQDSLERRPISKHLEVKVLGRNDDLIVLSTGEKVLPQTLEAALCATDFITTAIVFGQYRDEIGVIVEPMSPISSDQVQQFIDSVWAVIEMRNINVDRHARISSRSMIIIKPAEKQIPRSDKGSVMRKETYEMLKDEISAAYAMSNTAVDNLIILSSEPGKLESDLRTLIECCFQDRIPSVSWTDSADFFGLGMDSLEATRLARLLNTVQDKSSFPVLLKGEVKPSFIYQHPSVLALASALLSRDDPADFPGVNNRVRLMTELSTRFSPSWSGSNKAVVLLTGSTGSLGVQLLEQLCQDSTVEQIICLMRRRNGDSGESSSSEGLKTRQDQSNAARGVKLRVDDWAKIRFLSSDLSAKYLGLGTTDYHDLTRVVTRIIHNAWPMDFQRTLRSFEPQIRAVSNLIEFSIQCQKERAHLTTRLLFISSIAVGARLPTTVLREAPITDPKSTAVLGYAEAKWVCEKLLANAVSAYPGRLQPTIIRLGQLTGATNSGIWSENEHLPTILKVSQIIGSLPDLDGTYSWIPVNTAARSILEILSSENLTSFVYHVENPIRQPWKPLITALARKMNLPSLDPLPLKVWLRHVSSRVDSIVNLYDFLLYDFERLSGGGLILDTAQARKASYTLRTCSGVSLDLLDLYLDCWRKDGFIQ